MIHATIKKKVVELVLPCLLLMTLTTMCFGSRIYIENGQFKRNGSQIWLNGANTPWIAWDDFGGNIYGSSFSYSDWDNHFQQLASAGINCTRVWLSCDGGQGMDITSSGYVVGPTAQFWADVDSLMQIAQNRGIYVMAALISFDHSKSGSPKVTEWRNMYASQSNMNSFVENYAVPLVQRYANNPYLFSIDVCNEIMWVSNTENADMGSVPWANLQYLVAKTAQRVHETSSTLVCVSNYLKYASPNYNGNKWSNSALQAQVNDSDAYVDFYKIHYYAWVYPWFGGVHVDHTPANLGISDKPCITGEISAKGVYFQDPNDGYATKYLYSIKDAYEKSINNGWQGAMAWSSNGVDAEGDLNNDLRTATLWVKNNYPNLVDPSGSSTTVSVTGVSVSPTSASIEVGGSTTLTASVSPSNATNKNVSWSSANTSVATVSSSGTVTGVSSGTTTITVTTEDGSKTSSCTVSVTSASQSSYLGSAVALPANRVEAENFDNGGEGVAYHDNDSSNNGGQYRSEGVDIETCSEGGYNVGWSNNGEWLEYTVNITTTGNYTVKARAASNNNNCKFDITFSNGNKSTGDYNYNATGGWQSWTTLEKTGIALNAGEQVMRVNFKSSSVNLNYIELVAEGGSSTVAVTGVSVSPTSASIAVGGSTTLSATIAPSNATNQNVSWSSSNSSVASVNSSGVVSGVAAGTATITATTQDGSKTATCTVTVTAAPSTSIAEAESGTLTGCGVASSLAGYSGTGYVDGGTFSGGDKIQVTLNSTGGTKTLRIRYAAVFGGKYQYIDVNGSQVGSIEFPSSSGWATKDISINTTNGSNTILMTASWGWMHVDSFELL